MVAKWVDGAENLIDERVAYATDNGLSPRVGAPYREAGAPWRKVWHTTEVTPSSLAGVRNMAVRHRSPPHLWADHRFDWVGQTVPLDLSAYALLHRTGDPETNHAHAIQTEVIGFAGSGPLRGEVADWLGRRVLAPVLDAGVPIEISVVAPSTGSNGSGIGGAVRQTWTWWRSFNGQCGHANVPGNVHWDPGVADYERIAQAAQPPTPEPDPVLEEDDVRIISNKGRSWLHLGGDQIIGMTATDRENYMDSGVPESVVSDDAWTRWSRLTRADT